MTIALTGADATKGDKASGLFDILGMRMDYLKQRQAVIAQNVSNADSPGYKAHDLVSFTKALKGVGVHPVEIAQTNEAHISPNGRAIASGFGDNHKAKTYEVLPTGNSVVLEEQMMNVAQTNNDYQVAATLYRDAVSMMKMALGKTGAA